MHILAIMLAAVILYVSPSSADIYKYVDDNGVVCYTDAPMGKKTVRVLKEKKGAEKKEKSFSQQTPTETGDNVSTDYTSYVQQAATKYEIEPDLIKAVIKAESNGNHRAVSSKGAMGLMQLMPSTAYDMNVVNPFNPEENIEGGTRYLRSLLERFNGDLTLALAAYNAGPKTVEKYNSVPPISETKQYVKKIMSIFRGKGSYSFNESPGQGSSTPQPVPIYRVVLDDGTVLFTNSSYTKTGKVRF